jgi:hypothetical protein
MSSIAGPGVAAAAHRADPLVKLTALESNKGVAG